MRRRALLTSLAAGVAGVAGCSFGVGETDEVSSITPADRPTPDSSTTHSPATATNSGGDPPRPETLTRVINLETGPRTYALDSWIHAPDGGQIALWFDRTATPSHPARLRGWFQNGTDAETTFTLGEIPMVGQIHGRPPAEHDEDDALHLAPTPNNDLARRVPAVVRADSGYWRADEVGPWMVRTARLGPGEWARLEFELVGSPGMRGRPTGTYRFGGDTSLNVWDSNSPGPSVNSRFAGRSVPTFPSGGQVQWYHEAGPGTAAFVRPSTERLELNGRVDFEMVNHSRETLQCGHWNLYKLVDGEWFYVAPRMHTDDCRGLPPGGTKQWSLWASQGDPIACGDDCKNGGLSQGYLGGGEYAAVAGYGHPVPQSGALVELRGDPVSVEPTPDAIAQRDGATVTVTTDQFDDGQHPPDGTLTLERTGTATERLIAEQLMAGTGAGVGRGLRNTLPFLTDETDRVVLRTDAHVVDNVVGYDEQNRRFTVRGEAYVVSRNTGEA
ncbi:hypothetical protein [Haloarcula amylovorans]|uniref:hypothetical protein n=1 Tax=Haloarcula amylovorans TaxID=2562280 RepID=UPI001075E358|nr:hypothetical protein [Halomicroarcula amylolytica]